MRNTLLLACLGAVVSAQEKWSVDDMLLVETATQFRLSPDTKMVAWIKSQMDKEKGESASNLYLKFLSDGYEVAITRGTDSHTSPRFSPDGKKLYWLSSRKPATTAGGNGPSEGASGGMQVWSVDLRGGEPAPVTRLEKGVRSFDFIDESTLLLVATEDSTLHDQKVKEQKDTSNVVEDERNAAPVRLFTFHLKNRSITRLSENSDRISSATVSPDGRWAVTTHDRSLRYVYDQAVKPATFLYDLKNPANPVQLYADGKIRPGQIRWTPDSRGFYFTAPFTTHPKYDNASINLLYYYDLAAKSETKVDLAWPNGLAFSYTLVKDGVLATLANGARNKLALYSRIGSTWRKNEISCDNCSNIFSLEGDPNGSLVVYRHSRASIPDQIFSATVASNTLENSKQLTDLNAGWKKREFAQMELVRWKGAREEEVEGLLYFPHSYQQGKKYPLVVMIHGGPFGADLDMYTDRWGYPHQLFAQKGAFIFKPNYHGSSNYGLAWGESIANGMYNELEWIDVEKGVDSLIARGLVDPAKLGVMGWSNGSIIAIELTTRTTRYKVASAGAGDVNWTSDWGNAVFGQSFDDYYLGKTPIQDPQLYIRKSPLFRMDKVRTPTIIFFGTEDKQVPTEQGWQHYRALQQLGKTDVRFILFPGEAHGPRKYVHQKRKIEEELAWFDKYLFQPPAAEKNESLKTDSPLAAALKRKALGSQPDLVTRGSLQISRFEVTRSQYAEFDSSYKVAPGSEHHPASGISYDQAKKYADWLSAKTGRKYRLGTEEEMQSFLKPAKGENTLDSWAGYTVNIDDAKRLASLVEGLGTGALLKPVGSQPGSGDDPIFDLGGNVAEWVVAKDGSGKVLGGSADRPADPKSAPTSRTDYIGFRVVTDAK